MKRYTFGHVLLRPYKENVGVNFINILRASFLPIFLHQKLLSQNVTREKVSKALLYKRFVHKMLMKLTLGKHQPSN